MSGSPTEVQVLDGDGTWMGKPTRRTPYYPVKIDGKTLLMKVDVFPNCRLVITAVQEKNTQADVITSLQNYARTMKQFIVNIGRVCYEGALVAEVHEVYCDDGELFGHEYTIQANSSYEEPA